MLTAGAVAVGDVLQVRDYGLLDAAVARPRTSVFGLDAYPDDFAKAAALLQSLARNHAFVAHKLSHTPKSTATSRAVHSG